MFTLKLINDIFPLKNNNEFSVEGLFPQATH